MRSYRTPNALLGMLAAALLLTACSGASPEPATTAAVEAATPTGHPIADTSTCTELLDHEPSLSYGEIKAILPDVDGSDDFDKLEAICLKNPDMPLVDAVEASGLTAETETETEASEAESSAPTFTSAFPLTEVTVANTNIAGYSFYVKASNITYEVSSKPATELGSTVLYAPFGGSIEIANSTPERAFPVGIGRVVALLAAYPLDSAVCAQENARTGNGACWLTSSGAVIEDDIPAGGTVALKFVNDPTIVVNGRTGLTVPDSEVEAYSEALSKPLALALGYGYGSTIGADDTRFVDDCVAKQSSIHHSIFLTAPAGQGPIFCAT